MLSLLSLENCTRTEEGLPRTHVNSRSGMTNLEPNTNLNCWSNINVSGASSPLVRPPSRGPSTTLILFNRDR
jgi:hypothetical protein